SLGGQRFLAFAVSRLPRNLVGDIVAVQFDGKFYFCFLHVLALLVEKFPPCPYHARMIHRAMHTNITKKPSISHTRPSFLSMIRKNWSATTTATTNRSIRPIHPSV